MAVAELHAAVAAGKPSKKERIGNALNRDRYGGIMLWRQSPLSGAWATGVLFGIKLIFSGRAIVIIGRRVKKMAVDTQAA